MVIDVGMLELITICFTIIVVMFLKTWIRN